MMDERELKTAVQITMLRWLHDALHPAVGLNRAKVLIFMVTVRLSQLQSYSMVLVLKTPSP